MDFHVVWRLYPHMDLLQMSSIMSGLAILARKGVISLGFDFAEEDPERAYAAMHLTVTRRATRVTRSVILDFYDSESRLVPAIESADLYFKRQYGPQTISAGRTNATKLRPLGMTIAAYSAETMKSIGASIFAYLRPKARLYSTVPLRTEIRRAIGDVRQWNAIPDVRSVIAQKADRKTEAVVFQPRLWDAGPEYSGVFDRANEDRIATVSALRSRFPNCETVGLIHTDFARRIAPDLLLTRKVLTAEYHAQLRSAEIGVNCSGLSGSVGWKLAEYLAAGAAVVSQPIEKIFLAPFEAGKNYLPYSSPDACVEQCERLLRDKELAAQMREANQHYFRSWVEPSAHALRLLELSV